MSPKPKTSTQKKTIVQKNSPVTKKISKPDNKIINLDASGQVLGRLSTQVAIILQGKLNPLYRPYILNKDKVIVYNASKIKVTGNKLDDKYYFKHSGYIGNLKKETMKDVFRKNPGEIIRRSVKGMLPKNKLQDKWLKNLIIYNGDLNARN